MPKIVVTSVTGQVAELDAVPGRSIMEIIRDSGSDDLLALCGGCASCGTCHVYLDEVCGGKFQAIESNEEALLATSEHRKPQSRLSCRLRFRRDLDGLRVTIAPRP